MKFTQFAWNIFNQSISDYHITDDVNQSIKNPYSENSIEALLYQKNWIDTVQWHLEDIIRDPQIHPEEVLKLKRWIDTSNQQRTDVVELFDDYFQIKYKNIVVKSDAKINTESPAWSIDRLSILALKIFHMEQETKRVSASTEHIKKCSEKLHILKIQHQDLSTAIEELFEDLQNGTKYMKSYKQMKMYNDEELNPVLYKK